MGRFVKGEVVVVPFPFTDLQKAKRRPAFVLTALEGEDYILCQITSRAIRDQDAIALANNDFVLGGLRQESHARPNRLFTADRSIILYSVGKVSREEIAEIIDRAIAILRR